MASLAIVQPQLRADRIKLITLDNKTRTSLVPGVPTAIEQGYPSLTFEGLHGLIGLKSMPKDAQGEDRGRFQGGGGRWLDRGEDGGLRLGDQYRGPGRVRRRDHRTARRRRRDREGDQLQTEELTL